MSMKHLEVSTVKDWLRKQRIRGENNKRLSSKGDYRELGFRRKREIFCFTIRKHGYGLFNSLFLFVLLFAGNMFYFFGGCKYALREAHTRA